MWDARGLFPCGSDVGVFVADVDHHEHVVRVQCTYVALWGVRRADRRGSVPQGDLDTSAMFESAMVDGLST